MGADRGYDTEAAKTWSKADLRHRLLWLVVARYINMMRFA